MFLSRKEVASSVDLEVYMRKLNKKKVRWIIKQMQLSELSVWQIARQQDISSRWARKLFEKWQVTREYPFPKKPGRPATPIPAKIQKIVEKTYKKTPIGAVKMEQLFNHQGTHTPSQHHPHCS